MTCFITFETEDGIDRCENYLFKYEQDGSKNKYFKPMKMLDVDVEVCRANEPSDIIWENLEYSWHYMKKMQVFVGIIILIFIALSFFLFTYLKSTAGKNKMKYPTDVDCNALNS